MPDGITPEAYQRIGALATQYDLQYRVYNGDPQPTGTAATTLLYCRLLASDVRSTVILGDPTVTLPKVPS